ncbi:MAG: DNA polymerase IV, partial [Dinghuibacter sp.]|nr:DNA polymerase IV [Dinghuibacter sp.]
NPSLKGKPLLVGGHSDRGVVSACSYEARKYGIHSAMPMRRAKQLCPHAVIVSGSYGDYGKYSRFVTEIIAARAPLFQKASIDEFYIDLTGMDTFHDVYEWTKQLRQEIIDKTMLPVSFGLSSGKMVSKIAANEAKPNGYLFVPFGKEKEFLAPLPVGKIPGVGESLQVTMKQMGIHTIGDLQQWEEAALENRLGKIGADLYYKARGEHTGTVTPYHEAKSISAENTFHEDTTDMEFLLKQLVRLTEKIGYELRADGKLCTCVAVKIRYDNFETHTRQTTIPATDFDHVLMSTARELFQKACQQGRKIRLLGVRFSSLTTMATQASLFEDKTELNSLYKAIDKVKDRFGKSSVKRGSSG